MEAVIGLGHYLVGTDVPCVADIPSVAPLREAQRPAIVVDRRYAAVENLAGEITLDETRILRNGKTGKRSPYDLQFATGDSGICIDEFTDVGTRSEVQDLPQNLLILVSL